MVKSKIGLLLLVSTIVSYTLQKKYSFRNKTIFITGGTKGIGAAIGKYLVENEHISTLVVCSSNKQNVDRARELFRSCKTNVDVFSVQCDVTNSKEVDQVVHKFCPDMIITSAGVNTCKHFRNTTNEDFRKQFEVDCLGVINCTRSAVKHMSSYKRHCKIVNISSLLTTFPLVGYSAFCAGKGAVGLALDSIQNEHSKDKLTVHHVLAPAVDTDMLSEEKTIDELVRIFGEGHDCGADEFARYVIRGIKSNHKYITYDKNWSYKAATIIADSSNIPRSFYQVVYNCVFLVPSYIVNVLQKKYILSKNK